AGAHARRQPRHREAQRLQGRRQQGVLLEAVAAAPAAHQLRLQALQVEQDRPAQEDAQVLEGDVRGVGEVERVQHRKGRRAVARVADARQVGVEVEGGARVHAVTPGVTVRGRRGSAYYRPCPTEVRHLDVPGVCALLLVQGELFLTDRRSFQ